MMWCGIWYDLICLVWHVSCINKSHDDDYHHVFWMLTSYICILEKRQWWQRRFRKNVSIHLLSFSLHNIKYILFTSRLLHRVLCLLVMGKGQKPHLHRITIMNIVLKSSFWHDTLCTYNFTAIQYEQTSFSEAVAKNWSICPFYLSLFAHTHTLSKVCK